VPEGIGNRDGPLAQFIGATYAVDCNLGGCLQATNIGEVVLIGTHGAELVAGREFRNLVRHDVCRGPTRQYAPDAGKGWPIGSFDTERPLCAGSPKPDIRLRYPWQQISPGHMPILASTSRVTRTYLPYDIDAVSA
jgi:hypothetical protein